MTFADIPSMVEHLAMFWLFAITLLSPIIICFGIYKLIKKIK